MNEGQIELLRETLDMLVLKIVALGPSHGYAIAQRLQQISKDFFQVHQAQQILDNLAADMSPEDARRDALIKLGGIERVKEEVRGARWETQLENFVRDFRYALRNLRNDRRLALTAILTLALGIGSTTM